MDGHRLVMTVVAPTLNLEPIYDCKKDVWFWKNVSEDTLRVILNVTHINIRGLTKTQILLSYHRMNRILKFRQSEERKVLWVSDTHLNHAPKWPVPIWEIRGYNSAQHHTDSIIDAINQAVRPNDVLMHAGDFCLNTEENGLNELLARIQCQYIYMLFGNHNNPLWKIYQREIHSWLSCNDEGYNSTGGGSIGADDNEPEIYPFRYKNLVFIGNYAEITVDGQYFVLSHYPISSWNYMKNGSIHLYGHQHCHNNPTGGKQMDIGFDRDKRPYSTEEILEIMNKTTVVSDGGHH